MTTKYLAWKDANCNGNNIEWLELTGREFYALIKSPAGKGRYRSGASATAELARRFGCNVALLKEKSPSCGSDRIYDGSFSHTVIPGDGVAAETLKAMGLCVLGESKVNELL